MKFSVATEGGVAFFPGLARPLVVDSDKLDAGQARSLTELLDTASFWSLPAAAPDPGKARDLQSTTITVADGERSHTVRRYDPLPRGAGRPRDGSPLSGAFAEVIRSAPETCPGPQVSRPARGPGRTTLPSQYPSGIDSGCFTSPGPG